MDTYILCYINTADYSQGEDGTFYYDRSFDSIVKLMAFVKETGLKYTSYQIIVLRKPH